MEELKPCVHCGCTFIAIGRNKISRVYRICVNCDARGPLADSVKEATDVWNKRREKQSNERENKRWPIL